MNYYILRSNYRKLPKITVFFWGNHFYQKITVITKSYKNKRYEVILNGKYAVITKVVQVITTKTVITVNLSQNTIDLKYTYNDYYLRIY